MRIQLSGLHEEPHTFNRKCSAVIYFDDIETFPDDLSIRATVNREGNSLRLLIDAELTGCFNCDRCGAPLKNQYHCREEFFFMFEEDDHSLEDHESGIIPRGALELDISQEIRDTIILTLPYQHFCTEDCRGICPKCGVDLNKKECKCQHDNVEPRWEALKELKKKKK
ncbi:hypothetical protein CEE37_02015 [candidate division LCP-89 bacterium B3_LCP]|uniref:DNA-binding protein n=1 Tax=candidate division LCP-89 bacterium B3_LCP TaxID=2012998 RepID=A0A532V5K5_UNCL8|nr:MAG: hypothetical protein CEE37_02015 [candidate division LCP-89 bacterium B3_LCP]